MKKVKFTVAGGITFCVLNLVLVAGVLFLNHGDTEATGWGIISVNYPIFLLETALPQLRFLLTGSGFFIMGIVGMILYAGVGALIGYLSEKVLIRFGAD